MGATNHTANYNLSQFVGTDKPAWLQDYNGDMTKIDAGINAAKLAADSAALDAGAAQSDATAANNAITNTITPAITSLQTTVGNQGGSINTITSLIGNGTPTTTDQTIIGAINEINAEVGNTIYNTMNITSATKRSDILTIVKNSILAGKIPHIITDFVFTASGISYNIKDEICTYANDYEGGTTLQFGGFYARHTLLLSLDETGASLVSSDTSQPVTSFSNAILYY